MKRRYTLFTALLFVLSLALAACGGGGSGSPGNQTGGSGGSGDQQVATIKVGVLEPFTGANAYTANQIKMGIEAATKQVNDAGGIKSLGGAKIELVYGDTQGKPEVGATEAERLITRENVVALIGAYQSAVTVTTTQVAERYGVPHMIDIGIANDILDRGFKYSFRVIGDARISATHTVMNTAALAEATGMDLSRVVILHENTGFGVSMVEVLTEQAPKYGLELVEAIGYSPAATDLTTEVTKALQHEPDVILWSGYLADTIIGSRAFHQLRGKETVKAVIGNTNGAYSTLQFIEDVGEELAQGFFDSNHRWNHQSEDFKYLMGELEKQNANITHDVVDGFVSAQVLYAAIERAGSTDRDAIRDAIAATDQKFDILPQQENVKFDETGQNLNAKLVLTQIQGNEIVVVLPEEWAEAEPQMWGN